MTKNLLAMAVGIKQKKVVDEIVQKVPDTLFLLSFEYQTLPLGQYLIRTVF